MSLRQNLVAAEDARSLVRIERKPRYADDLEGFVVAVGARWALIACVLEGGYPDGYRAIRVDDVRRVRAVKGFEEKFARSLPTWPRVAPKGALLDRTSDVVETLSKVAPLIGLLREDGDDELVAGVVAEVAGKRVRLQVVDRDGTWATKLSAFKLGEVTSVDIRDCYLTALASYAGLPPAVKEGQLGERRGEAPESKPAEGEEEEVSTPSLRDSAQPAEGEDSAQPAEGEDSAQPAEGADPAQPAEHADPHP